MNNNSKMILVAMLGAVAIIIAGIVIFNDDENQNTTPLTAEQQLVNELKTALPGDIIVDPSGTLVDKQIEHFLVCGVSISENNEYSLFMFPINSSGKLTAPLYWNQNELVRANVQLAVSGDYDWLQIVRRYTNQELAN